MSKIKIMNSPKGFYRTQDGKDWRIETNDDPRCIECDIQADVIATEEKSYGNNVSDGRGSSETFYDQITVKCPECKKEGSFDSELSKRTESTTYQSNEYSRVFGK